MKALFLIGCLLISVNVFAQTQKRDTFYVDASKKKMLMRSAVIDSNRSYVTINGKVYTGLLERLNTDSIAKFSIIKPPDAVTLFGEKGKNGAILITMKEPTVPGQAIVELPPSKKHITDYVLDGEPSSKAAINALEPRSILDVKVLKYDKKSVAEEFKGKTTLIAITRNFAIKQYQKKLSAFSKKYKNYLELNKEDDSKLSYVLNGKLFDENDKRIKSLYDIPPGKIKEVIFMEKFYKNTLNNIKEIVIITTK